MKMTKLVLQAMLFLVFAHPWAIFGASEESPSRTAAQERKSMGTSSDLQPASQEQQSGPAVEMPVYKPPLRGAPAGRVGGGTRGSRDQTGDLVVLAPDHVGLTVQKQPSLYWFLSTPFAYPTEFTLIENKAVKPLLETRLESGASPGLQCIRLSDHGVGLQPGVLYRWFITLIPDEKRRSKDILSGGLIERIEPPEEMKQPLGQDEMKENVRLYAEAGFWYDAFMAVCHLIERSPDDVHLRQMRASLLLQVGLGQVAKELR